MNPENYSKFCDVCIFKSFSPDYGILCSKVNKKPDFDLNCIDFEETNASLMAKKFIRENPVDPDRFSVNNSKNSNPLASLFLGIVFIVLGFVFLAIGFLNRGNFFNSVSVSIVNFGLGFYKFFQVKR